MMPAAGSGKDAHNPAAARHVTTGARTVRPADIVVGSLSLLCGLAIGFVDSRPGWDDTGITVGAVLLSAGALALVRPRWWWIVGLAVGAPVVMFNYLASGRLDAMVAALIALVAAGMGGGVGRLAGLGGTRPRRPWRIAAAVSPSRADARRGRGPDSIRA